MAKSLPEEYPTFHYSERHLTPELRAVLDNLIYTIRLTYLEIIKAVNYNRLFYFSQAGQPTTSQLSDGQIALWNDSDATSGNPTHYIVVNDGGTIRTFASEELVP